MKRTKTAIPGQPFKYQIGQVISLSGKSYKIESCYREKREEFVSNWYRTTEIDATGKQVGFLTNCINEGDLITPAIVTHFSPFVWL